MEPTQDLDETIQERLKTDVDFRHKMLARAVQSVMTGDAELSKSLLSQCVGAMISFKALGRALGKKSKHVMSMLSPKGLPSSENLFKILTFLHKQEGREFDPAEAYYQRGRRRLGKGDLDGAVADLNQAIRFNPDHKRATIKRDAALEKKATVEQTSLIRLVNSDS